MKILNKVLLETLVIVYIMCMLSSLQFNQYTQVTLYSHQSMQHNNNIHLNIKIIKKDNNINPWMPKQVKFFSQITVQQLKLLPTRPTGSIMYTFSTSIQPTQAEEGMGRFSMFSMVALNNKITAVHTPFHYGMYSIFCRTVLCDCLLHKPQLRGTDKIYSFPPQKNSS